MLSKQAKPHAARGEAQSAGSPGAERIVCGASADHCLSLRVAGHTGCRAALRTGNNPTPITPVFSVLVNDSGQIVHSIKENCGFSRPGIQSMESLDAICVKAFFYFRLFAFAP